MPQIVELCVCVFADEKIDLDAPEWSDVNIVTGCLKLYLRELPDPLIPFRLYKPFIEAASMFVCCVCVFLLEPMFLFLMTLTKVETTLYQH